MTQTITMELKIPWAAFVEAVDLADEYGNEDLDGTLREVFLAGLEATWEKHKEQDNYEVPVPLKKWVAEAICGCWYVVGFGDAKDSGISLERIAWAVHNLSGVAWTPKKIGHVVRTELHLETRRSSGLTRKYYVVLDPVLIEQLQERFAMTPAQVLSVAELLQRAAEAGKETN